MARGKVKWFSDQKSFGFIIPDDGGRDVFVHWRNIEYGAQGDGFKTLSPGMAVEYDLKETGKGPQAYSVRSLEVKEKAM